MTYAASASQLANCPLSKDVDCGNLNEMAIQIAQEVSKCRCPSRALDTTRLNKNALPFKPCFLYFKKFEKQKINELWKALEIPCNLRATATL